MNKQLQREVEAAWAGETLEALSDFIRIPSKNKVFDPEWAENGYLKAAVEAAAIWGAERFPTGSFEVLEREGASPALWIDIPATDGRTGRPAFFYAHFDKQPEAGAWSEELAPWSPVVRDGKLYGRGSVDDGYGYYLALTAVLALERSDIPHPRITGLFECDEESGSHDLGPYLEQVAPRAGNPAFLGILDLGALDDGRLWLTRSLRGVVSLRLTVRVLETPVHSGTASGLVPSSFDVMRVLLDRLSDPKDGRVLVEACSTPYPEELDGEISALAALLGDKGESFAWAGGTHARTSDPKEAIVRTAWMPSLSFLGADGFPSTGEASALIRPSTSLFLSFRIPPRVNAREAFEAVRATLLADPPCGAEIEIDNVRYEEGFETPPLSTWFEKAWRESSLALFSSEPASLFEGASIGTLGRFRRTFPRSDFLTTGALLPGANAHAPDESLDLGYAAKLTEAVAHMIAAIPEAEDEA